eukprot:763940-Hanusia_phi.AAC.9
MDGTNQYGYYQQGMGDMQNYQMPNNNMVPVANSDGGYMYQNPGGMSMGNTQASHCIQKLSCIHFFESIRNFELDPLS